MNYWEDRFGMIDVSNYKQLRDHFDRAIPFRGTKDRPFGKRKYGNRRMRMLDDETIELEYYGHSLVRWHPDGEVSVWPHQCQRQGVFDRLALPKGIRCDMGTRNGPIMRIFPSGNISWWIVVPKGPDEPRRYEGDDTNYVRNTNFITLKGDKWVRLRPNGKTWYPVDEDSLTPFEWLEPDNKRKRALSKEYRIPDMVNAARAMLSLGIDNVVGAEANRYNSLAYNPQSADDLLRALKAGDFTTVLRNMRTVENRKWDPATGTYSYETIGVSSTDVKALRDRLCVLVGICDKRSEKILDGAQFARSERMLKDFGPAC
jgi:hypothetical protein